MAKKLTLKQQQFRKNLLASIHQAPLFIQMDEEDYRDMLDAAFGKRSAGLLSINQLTLLLDYLRGNRPFMLEMVTPAQAAHIQAAWAAKGKDPSMRGLRAFVNSNFGKSIMRVDVLSKKEASGVIAALNRMPVLR